MIPKNSGWPLLGAAARNLFHCRFQDDKLLGTTTEQRAPQLPCGKGFKVLLSVVNSEIRGNLGGQTMPVREQEAGGKLYPIKHLVYRFTE